MKTHASQRSCFSLNTPLWCFNLWPYLLCTCALVLLATDTARAQHGRFDQSPVNPADEAAIFTPPGFTKAGKVVTASAGAARLKVTVLDRETKKPTPCRVNVVGPDGNFYQPADNPLSAYSLNGVWPETLAGNRPSKAPIRYFGHFFYTTGNFEVAVPAGQVRIEVWKGFEYAPVVESIKVEDSGQQEARIVIGPGARLSQRGWYSGDPHLHFIRASDNDDKTIFDLLEAEDIRRGLVLCYNDNTSDYRGVMPELATPQLHGLGSKSIRARGDYQIISGQEYRNGLYGHLNLFLRDRLVLEGERLDPNIGPPFGVIGAETRAAGGYAVHAHGGYGLEIWADLVQGATNGVELLQFGIYRGIGLEGWYHVLGAGFRFPAVGACDYPACRKLGDCRTYVHVTGEPTMQNWLAGAAAGRSFVTSGPLIELTVDGKLPGDTVSTADEKPLKVQYALSVQSPTTPVQMVQIIVNGQVARELKIPPASATAEQKFEGELELTRSSWVAARAFSESPTGTADAESHTNPVYVHLNDKPPYDQQDLDWLAERLDEQIADHQARKVPEKQLSIDYIQRSRELLREIRQRGGRTAAEAQASATTSPKTTPGINVRAATVTGDELVEFLKPVPALSPADALKSFETVDGFQMQLVAHEPDVTDPVAACFDENGGMYVAEMIDYPYRPKEGQAPLGRVRYLQDADGDGRFERSWIFADAIVWPTGVVCWKGGVYVSAAPDVWYLKDTDGDHRADVREKVYTGFGDRNQQGGVNNLNWHVDHHIYGSGSTNGGSIRPADKPDVPPIVLSGRDFRFDPESRKFETVSGSRQFGNAFDNWFNRFTCDESGPAYHIVLPQHYLARNPHLAVPSAMNDLAPGVTPIFRISPIERWREVRSSRRAAAGERSVKSSGLSHNVIDAAAGLTIYRGHAYPEKYLGQLFVGCSQNNLIHRRTLSAKGPTFDCRRADENTEFVRSTDIWFRPVNCINAPDGTIYVLDMSREVIESIHIANDVVAHLDLTSGRDKGRIYRLAPPDFKPSASPKLGTATTAELVATLEHPGGWWRDTASRLIYERQDPTAVPLLRARLSSAPAAESRMHILWALEGLGALEDRDLAAGLADASAGVREHAIRLSEPRLRDSQALLNRVIALASDDDPRVRFQAAFTLGQVNDPRVVPALAMIATRDAEDKWTRTAVLSSCAEISGALLARLSSNPDFLAHAASHTWIHQLAEIVGARNQPAEITALLDTLLASANDNVQHTVVMGLGAGLARVGANLEQASRTASAPTTARIQALYDESATKAVDSQATPDARAEAVRLLVYFANSRTEHLLTTLVDPRQPESVHLAAVRGLTRYTDAEPAKAMIAAWRASTPQVQDEIIGVLASRQHWVPLLLSACDQQQINPSQITRSTRTALLNHADSEIKTHAEQLLGGANSPRGDVIARYQAALNLSGDATRGDKVFERECLACHRLGERGYQVGPNLALVRNRTPAALLEAILDPNREVHPTYVNYIVVDDSGRTTTGLILSETAGSVTMGREKGATETIQKTNIEQLKSTGQSLMPEGLEKNIDTAGMADLLAFLKQVQYDIGTLPDFAQPKE